VTEEYDKSAFVRCSKRLEFLLNLNQQNRFNSVKLLKDQTKYPADFLQGRLS